MTDTFNVQAQKTCIFGIQGSGKTYLAKYILRFFKKPIVFVVNEDDNWHKEKCYVFLANRMKIKEDFNVFITQARQWALDGKVDAIFIDEADMFFQTNYDLNAPLTDIVLNHRHMNNGKGCALVLMTRRPQDIPTKIVESSMYLMVFKLEGANAIERFKEIHPRIPEYIKKLDYDKHNFVYKKLGENPVIHNPIRLEEKK